MSSDPKMNALRKVHGLPSGFDLPLDDSELKRIRAACSALLKIGNKAERRGVLEAAEKMRGGGDG